MTETTQRSLLERLVGRPLPWLVWAWVVLAGIWIVLAFVDPSGFHTFMAIVWTILSAAQIASVLFARRRERRRVEGTGHDSGTVMGRRD